MSDLNQTGGPAAQTRAATGAFVVRDAAAGAVSGADGFASEGAVLAGTDASISSEETAVARSANGAAGTRPADGAVDAKADAASLMPPDPDALTWRARLLTPANVLFALFLLVNLLPDVTKKGSQAIYAIVPLAVVWAIQFVVALVTRHRRTRDLFVDVSSVVFLVFGAWLLFSAKLNMLPEKMFPAPGMVFLQIVKDYEKILQGVGSSLSLVVEGFLMGGINAIVLGLVLGSTARTNAAAEKVVTFLSAIPPIVYIPYGIALLPTFRASSLLVIFLATFWPTLTGTLAGVGGMDKRAVDSARVLNVGRATMLFRVTLPGSLPLIFNGLNIGLCLSFILLTSAEMIGGNTGMGYYVKFYSDFGDYARILAGILVIGVVITTISVLFAKLQKYLTRWK